MDAQERMANERIARMMIDDERAARSVSHLSEMEKNILLEMGKAPYQIFDGYMHNTHEAAAIYSLASSGLLRVVATKSGVGGRLTEKGFLLLKENPKLKFSSTPEKKWKISLALQIVMILISALALAFSIVSFFL